MLSWAGSALALAGIAFVVVRFRQYAGEIDNALFTPRLCFWLLGLTVMYAGVNVMLAFAWRDLLAYLGVTQSRLWALRIYGKSQLAKYVPGNIFHLAGRQVLGMAGGVAAWPLAKSSAWELGLIAAAGGLYAILAAPMLVTKIPLEVAAASFIMTVMVCAIMLRRWLAPLVAGAFGWHICFLAVSGLIFFTLLTAMAGFFPGPGLAISIIGAYVLAWLAGLVTPGAPAGVGIRELVLLALLGSVVEPPVLLMAVALGRVVTVSGDVLFFLACAAMPAQRVTPGAANAE